MRVFPRASKKWLVCYASKAERNGVLVTESFSTPLQPYVLPARPFCPWIIQAIILGRVAIRYSRGSLTQGWSPGPELQARFCIPGHGSLSREEWWSSVYCPQTWSWGRHSLTIRATFGFWWQSRKQAHGFSTISEPCKVSISIYIYQTFQIWDCTLDPETLATPFVPLTTFMFYPLPVMKPPGPR